MRASKIVNCILMGHQPHGLDNACKTLKARSKQMWRGNLSGAQQTINGGV